MGRQLGKLLKITFYDLDKWIEKEEGKSVAEIFQLKGEKYFREKEKLCLRELLNGEKKVIALGGGSVCNNVNLEFVKNNSLLIYLKLDAKFLAERLEKEKSQRPLIKNLEKAELKSFVEKHLSEREHFYLQAHLVVNALHLTAQQLRDSILGFQK